MHVWCKRRNVLDYSTSITQTRTHTSNLDNNLTRTTPLRYSFFVYNFNCHYYLRTPFYSNID